jgi:hypothetical protein
MYHRPGNIVLRIFQTPLTVAQAVATTTEYPATTGIETVAGSDHMGIILLSTNASADACTIDAKLRHCDTTDGTYEDVANTDTIQIPSTVDLAGIGAISVKATDIKKFTRVSVTTGAGTNGPVLAIVGVYTGFTPHINV